MSEYAENRAWLVRRAMGLRGPCDPRAAWKLAEWLGEAVVVRHYPGAEARCTCLEGGRVKIRVPVLPDERMDAMVLGHELGHWLAYEGWFPDAGRRLSRATARAERESDRFWRAFLLPAPVAGQVRCEDDLQTLCEVTGLSPDDVIRRTEETQTWRQPCEPSAWAAWHVHTVRRAGTDALWGYLVQDRHSSWQAWVPNDARTLARDLVALRPREFQAKYAPHRPRVSGEALVWREGRMRTA